MLPVHLVMTRVPLQNERFAQAMVQAESFLDHQRVDTVTVVSPRTRQEQALPNEINAVIRYVDITCGYRLLFVEERAAEVARMKWRLNRGDDLSSPDYAGSSGNFPL